MSETVNADDVFFPVISNSIDRLVTHPKGGDSASMCKDGTVSVVEAHIHTVAAHSQSVPEFPQNH